MDSWVAVCTAVKTKSKSCDGDCVPAEGSQTVMFTSLVLHGNGSAVNELSGLQCFCDALSGLSLSMAGPPY